MNAKRLVVRLLGILALVCGGLLGILVLRNAFFMLRSTILGDPPNIVAKMIQAWFLGLAAYLISLGLRGFRWASGKVEPKASKVKWGRVVLGSFFILLAAANISNHFHPDPNRFEFKASNDAEAAGMKVAQIVMTFLMPPLGVLLIFSGLRARSETLATGADTARIVS
jgi:hypothetical protein